MAVNKAKRSTHLAQPERPRLNPQPAELMPVRAHIYRTIAEVNDGFEHAIQGLRTLQDINYLRSEGLSETYKLVCRIRAQANRSLMTRLKERETANADYFIASVSETTGDGAITTKMKGH